MKSIEVRRGAINYEENGTGPTAIFIHGAFSSSKTWRKVIPELSKHLRCIVPEWPFGGHQTPAPDSLDFSPKGIAGLIDDVMEALNIERATIIANDTGGAYAQIFTSLHPHKVSHLILTNCEGFEVFPPKKFQSLKTMVKIPGYTWLMAQLFKYTPALKWDMTFGLLSHQLSKDELYEYYVSSFASSHLIRQDFRKLASTWNPKHTMQAASQLKRFNRPVLILWGVDDKKLFPLRLGKRIAAIFNQASFVQVEGSLTYIQEDRPDVFVTEIVRFLNVHKVLEKEPEFLLS